MSEMTVAALQLGFTDNMEADIAAVADLVRQAAARGAKVILPPELFQGYYFCRHEHERFFTRAYPTATHPAVVAMQALAAELKVYRKAASIMLGLGDDQIETEVEAGRLVEVKDDEQG